MTKQKKQTVKYKGYDIKPARKQLYRVIDRLTKKVILYTDTLTEAIHTINKQVNT